MDFKGWFIVPELRCDRLSGYLYNANVRKNVLLVLRLLLSLGGCFRSGALGLFCQ